LALAEEDPEAQILALGALQLLRPPQPLGDGEGGPLHHQRIGGVRPCLGTREMSDVTWDHLNARLGQGRFRGLLDAATLVGMVNWTMLPHMSRIWAKMLDEVIPWIEQAVQEGRL